MLGISRLSVWKQDFVSWNLISANLSQQDLTKHK